ncbi:MAG: hypothetical protein ABFD92_00275 [Planctomycetaceae bacterium]|nr:hypothetical protein [Planctomycetaceae bacterium]
MLKGPRAKQVVALLVAAAAVAAAIPFTRPVNLEYKKDGRVKAQLNLEPLCISANREDSPQLRSVVASNHPAVAMLLAVPGGLRAPLVNYLWIRSQELHQAGKHYDAMQLADVLCKLSPQFPGVWKFQSWQMAWNIAVTCDNREDRWRWVYNGIKLLRDQGLEINPTSILLYNQLAWTFIEKVHGDMDEMHWAYKQALAKMMQDILASPPGASTAAAIEAFIPIANAPVDYNPRRRADEAHKYIQADQLALILHAPADEKSPLMIYYRPQAADYAARLAALGVTIDRSLLQAYNAWSMDDAVSTARSDYQPVPADDRTKALADLINDPKYADARKALLAFVRAQILWNEQRMDSRFMLELMIRFDAPLDWRMAPAHALYWSLYGTMASGHKFDSSMDSLALARQVTYGLKDLTWYGRMTYEEDPANPNWPKIHLSADHRYIAKAQREYEMLIEAWLAGERAKGLTPQYKDNLHRDGHMNYLSMAIQILFERGLVDQAQHYLDWVRTHYQPSEPEWNGTLEDLLMAKLVQDKNITPQRIIQQLTAAIQSALVCLALDERAGYNRYIAYAGTVYQQGLKRLPQRITREWGPIKNPVAAQLRDLLIDPRAQGYELPLSARIKLYAAMADRWPSRGVDDPGPVLMVYDIVRPYLLRQCQAAGEPFDQAFPPPEFLEAYRAKRGQSLGPRPN